MNASGCCSEAFIPAGEDSVYSRLEFLQALHSLIGKSS